MSLSRISPGQNVRPLLGVYVPSFLISVGQGMVVPTIPTLAGAFHVSAGLAAQIVTAQALGRALFLFPAGFIVDWLGVKRSLLLGPALIGAGALLTAFAPSFVLLLCAQFVTGAGTTLWQLGREVSAIDLVRPDQRGRLLSGFLGVSTAGLAGGPLLGGLTLARYDFHAVFLVYAAIATAVIAIALTSSEVQRPRRPPDASPLRLGRLRDVEPQFRATFAVLLFASFVDFLYRALQNSVLPLYLGVQLQISPVQIGTLLGFFGLVNLIMVLPTGFISDKIGRKAASIPSAIFLGLSFAAYPLARTMPLLFAATAIGGIGAGLGLGSKATYTYDVIPAQARGRLQALRRTVGELGSLSGPVLGGVVANDVGPGASFLVFAPLQAIVAVLLIAVAQESLRQSRTVAAPVALDNSGSKE